MNSPAWNPFREMEELLDRCSRSTGQAMPAVYDELSAPDWAPCTDVEETADMYRLSKEHPPANLRIAGFTRPFGRNRNTAVLRSPADMA